MEDDIVDGELIGIISSGTGSKEGEMLGAKDGDVQEETTSKGSKSEDQIGAETESCSEGGGGGGGAIKDLISTLFHPDDEDGKPRKTDDEILSEENNGGIIRSIVSHLPPSLPEDAAPTTDEASILIHSIVHD